MKFGKHGELVWHVPLSAPKVDGVPDSNAGLAQRVADGGWLPLRVKRADRHAPPRQTVEIVHGDTAAPRLVGQPNPGAAPVTPTPVPSTANAPHGSAQTLRSLRAAAPQPKRQPDPARHAASLVAFLREREHQFSYDFSAYPDSDKWGMAALKQLKRKLGGRTRLTLNCWGLLFYAHHRTGNLSRAALEARARACDAAGKALPNDLQRTRARLQYLRQDLVGRTRSVPLDQVDFGRLAPGSTVAFNTPGSPLSHVAMMLDNGQMAHLIQSTTSPEALTRPDIAHGRLEITTPAAVIRLVRAMPMGRQGVFVAWTPGPVHFVPDARDEH